MTGRFGMKNYFFAFAIFFALFFAVSCSFTDSRWDSFKTASGAIKKNNARVYEHFDSDGKKLGVRLSFIVTIPNLVIPDTITGEKVVALAFSEVAAKTTTSTITFPESVLEFDNLSGFSSLNTLHLSKSLKMIPEKAFVGTSSLSTITLPAENPPKISAGVFANCASSLRIYVPRDSLDTYKATDVWKDYSDKLIGIDMS